jgi:hypothetical protein
MNLEAYRLLAEATKRLCVEQKEHHDKVAGPSPLDINFHPSVAFTLTPNEINEKLERKLKLIGQ